MVPTVRLVVLIALGAPLWLLPLALPAGWVVPIAWLGVLAVLAFRDFSSLPPASSFEVDRQVGRLSLGTPSELRLTLANRSGKHLRFRVREETAPGLGCTQDPREIEIPAHGTGIWTLGMRPMRRGHYALGEVVVRTGYPAGLLDRQIRIPASMRLSVYPRFATSDEHRLLARINPREYAARRARRVRGRGTEFESLATYNRGDDPRSVDWKASAKRGHLVVRNLQTERGQQIAIMIDGGRLMAEKIGEFARFEHALNATVMLSHIAQKRGDAVAVATFSDRVERFVPPTRGKAILPTVMDSLCAVEVRRVESDYWQVVGQVLANLKRRSLIVMLTDVLDAGSSAGLISNMTRARRRHLVLCVVLTERRVDDAASSNPQDSTDAFRQAAAAHLKVERHLALETMRSKGILILETPPEELSVELIRRYLEIRKANLL